MRDSNTHSWADELTSLSNLWEDCDEIQEIDDTIRSLDDLSLCGDSTKNYVVQFTFESN